jgi:hypothetical protein
MASRRLPSNFSLGGPDGEVDPLLLECFVDTGDFSTAVQRDDHHRFLIGRTGAGKSSIFRKLAVDYENRVVVLHPSDLAFQYIINVQAVDELVKHGVQLDAFFKALWKHIILCTLARHRYKDPTPETRRTLSDRLFRRAAEHTGKRRAEEYLDAYANTFWQETDEHIRNEVDTLSKSVRAQAKVGGDAVGVGASAGADASEQHEVSRELKERYQRIVNDAILQQPAFEEFAEEILESEHHFVYLVIDDLDTTMVDDRVGNVLIRSLLHVVLDLRRVQYLKVLVGLRTNIFDQLHIGSRRRGGQEEKLRGGALHLTWTRADLEKVVEERLHAASRKKKLGRVFRLSDVLPDRPEDGKDALSYILDRTLMRPRNLVNFLNLCLRMSTGKQRISWEVIHAVEPGYSQNRLDALRDEWNDPYFDIFRLFDQFRGAPRQMERRQLQIILENIALLREDDRFQGKLWLTPPCDAIWNASQTIDWGEQFGELAELLFDIGLLGFALDGVGPVVFGCDSPQVDPVVLRGASTKAVFAVHPTFHQALSII